MGRRVPYERIEVVLLDVGGTLISMDFSWVQEELRSRGIRCSRAQLERAEAAARPTVSRENAALLERGRPQLGFERFLALWFERLGILLGTGGLEPVRLATELSPILRPPGHSYRLWSAVLPGVEEALSDLTQMGLRLAVVSNSDGTVERSLTDHELRGYLEVVVDSAVVGMEKPDTGIFAHAMTAMRCSPEVTLHVGDMYFADVVGARGAGAHAVLLDPYDDWLDADCPRLPDLAAVRDRFRNVSDGGGG
jgi:putative hydrolase of the HAD superfamily